jgi:hypothetical protein
LFLRFWLGGEGFVEYSVKLNVLRLGVLGLPFSAALLLPLPFTTTPFSIFLFVVSRVQFGKGAIEGVVGVSNCE